MAMIALLIALFGAGISFGIWMIRWQYRSADAQLEQWLQRSHYRLLDKQRANPIGTGPMTRSGNKQVMYRVLVADASGVSRRALIKLGSPFMGVLSSDVAVEWES